VLRLGGRTEWNKRKSGAVAFSRQGSPDLGEFDDAVILKTFGEVSDDIGAQPMTPRRFKAYCH
jgi:hypothetical protein